MPPVGCTLLAITLSARPCMRWMDPAVLYVYCTVQYSAPSSSSASLPMGKAEASCATWPPPTGAEYRLYMSVQYRYESSATIALTVAPTTRTASPPILGTDQIAEPFDVRRWKKRCVELSARTT